MIISTCMKRKVVSIPSNAALREAASIFVRKHIGLLPGVDAQRRVVGVVGLRGLLTLELPDFVSFIAKVAFVHHFGAVETTRPEAGMPDTSSRAVITTAPDNALINAILAATQGVAGDLRDHETGIFLVLPVARAYGLEKRNKK